VVDQLFECPQYLRVGALHKNLAGHQRLWDLGWGRSTCCVQGPLFVQDPASDQVFRALRRSLRLISPCPRKE
jgi:hypothetical protein